MRLAGCHELKDLMQEFAIKDLDEKREKFLQTARRNIKKVQDENKKAFDLKRKQERVYQLNDLVAIKRTQYGVGLKLKGKFLAPYKIVAVKNHGRYEVRFLHYQCPTKCQKLFNSGHSLESDKQGVQC